MRSLVTLQRVDQAVSTLCLNHRFSAGIARVFRWVSKSGDGHLYAIVGLLLATMGGVQGMSFFIAGLMAFAVEVPLFMLFKRLFRRARPRHLPAFITPSDLYSMPSGHTAAAFVMAALLSHFYPEFSHVYWWWGAAIGASRVLLGVHFVTDVIAGALLGLACAEMVLLA